MSQIPASHEIYRHFKGNLYEVLTVAEHSETGEKLVIYQALYGDSRVYARPLESFTEKLDKEKYPEASQTYRFVLQEKTEYRLDEQVAAFLDADSYGERLNILAGLHHRITDDMITTMAIACDVEVPEGDLEERYQNLRNCLLTRGKYERERPR